VASGPEGRARQPAALQERGAERPRERGGEAVDGGAGGRPAGDLGEQVIGGDRGGDPHRLLVPAEPGQAERGFGSVRRAAETPFNRVLEARP